MRFFIRYLSVLMILASYGYGQDLINIKHYSTADGLSDNKIVSIIKDRDGFMWFSTWAGIDRFDGYNFKKFKSYPGDQSSLKNNRIDYMLEDKLGGFLWVRGYDNQVYRFNKFTEKFTALPDLINDDKIRKVLFKKILAVINNEVWLESINEGIFVIEDALGKYPKYKRYAVNQDPQHKLPSNKIIFFHVDSVNNAWVGTSMGVRILKPTSNCDYHVYTIKELDKEGFTNIIENKGINWLANGSDIISVERNLKKINIHKITEATITNFRLSKNNDKIFCSTSKGEIFSLKENGVTLLGIMKDHSPLYSILEGADGNLWVESENYGIVLLDIKTGGITELLPYKKYNFKPWIRNFSMFENNNKTVWIALNGYGLGYYDKKNKTIQSIVVKSTEGGKKLLNLIIKSFYDTDGVFWLVSDYGGIEKIVFKDQTFNQLYLKPESNLKFDSEVRGIFSDEKKRLWIGTRSGELYLYKDGERLETPIVDKYNFHSGIYSIFKDRTGCMWFGTKWDGLFQATSEKGLNSEKFKITNHFFAKEVLKSVPGENSIYKIMEDSKGRIWAGSYGGGLILIKDEKGEIVLKTIENSFKKYPSGNFRKIRYLAEDANGRIWIASTEGLVVFNPNDGSSTNNYNYRFKVYRKQNGNINSLGGNDVQFIYKDTKNRMWVLTASGGLNLAIGKKPLDSLTFKNFSTKEGLPSDFLLSCSEDSKQNLWLATQNGITKFSTLNHKIQNFSHYDGIIEGANFSESSCTKMVDGRLVFGNTSGYLSFNPLEIHSKKIKSNMVFTNIQINGEDIINSEKSIINKETTFENNLNLNYNQNIITINFAVLDFHSSDKQSYACRILGYDSVWRSTEHQTKITYTNLPPGDYTFQVKSLNDEFYKQVPFRSLNIKINPPFWKTWWAYVLYILTAIAFLILIQRVIYTMMKLRNGIELEKRLAELKLNFFTQISHELRTPLTLIVNPIEEVLNDENLSSKSRNYAKLVLKNSLRMTRLVNQVLDLRKVQSGKASLNSQKIELTTFIQNLINYFQATIQDRNLNVRVIAKHETFNVCWDLEKIEIVIYNLLANAIKFSPNGGNVNIVIEDMLDEEWCKIEVIDEGTGVLNEELKDIFNIYYSGKNKADGIVKSSGIGLALAKELIELHGGEIYAENIVPVGFKVAIKLKKQIQTDGQENEINKEEILPMYHQEQHLIDTDLSLDPSLNDLQKPKSTVLIVEDNEDLRNFLATKFKELYKVETAVDGEEGVKKAIEIIPDLILSDVMMPKLDGMQLLNKLKNNSLTSHIPIILLTAKNSVESHINSLKYGADYYLPKPLDMKLLSVAISNIIVRRNKFFKSILESQAEATENIDSSESIVITKDDKIFLDKTIEIVNENLKNPDFNIDTAADLMNMSRSAFFKKFKSLTNIAPVEFVRDTRLEKGKKLLEEDSEKNVSEIAYEVGFKNPKYFSSCFKTRYNINPTEFLKKNK